MVTSSAKMARVGMRVGGMARNPHATRTRNVLCGASSGQAACQRRPLRVTLRVALRSAMMHVHHVARASVGTHLVRAPIQNLGFPQVSTESVHNYPPGLWKSRRVRGVARSPLHAENGSRMSHNLRGRTAQSDMRSRLRGAGVRHGRRGLHDPQHQSGWDGGFFLDFRRGILYGVRVHGGRMYLRRTGRSPW